MNESKNILVLLDNNFKTDRRVQRECFSLVEAGFKVQLLCVRSKDTNIKEDYFGTNVERIFNNDIFDIKNINAHKRYAEIILNNYDFDIIHANDHTMLNIAVLIKNIQPRIKVVYDSHELFHSWPLNLSSFNSKIIAIKSIIVRKYLIKREAKNIRRVDSVITVNDSLAENIETHFKLPKPLVIRNIPELDNSRIEIDLRKKLNIPIDKKILVFIGSNIYRFTLNMEQVFHEFSNEKNIVVLVIASNNINRQNVEKYVKEKSYQNIIFHDAIPPDHISSYLSQCDVGIVPTWNKKDLSYWYALDNKLFEYLHAGIPILVTQQPEYKKIVIQNDCGVSVNPDKEGAYLNGFNQIIDNYSAYQEKVKVSVSKLNWDKESLKFIEFYKEL